MQLLGHMEVASFAFKITCQTVFSRMAIPFYIPKNNVLTVSFLASSPAFGVVSIFFFHFSDSDSDAVISMILICMSLMASD